jgi:predicted Zn-ribbon and HTH transcriptional regulator
VAAYGNPIEAHLTRCRLEAEGIEAFVADEHIVAVQWLYSAAVGGVKVRVRARDWEQARRVLLTTARRSRSARFITDDLHAPRCPRCGSLEVQKRFARRLTFASAMLFGFPLPLLRRRARCKTCGARWRSREDRPAAASEAPQGSRG